MATNFPTSLDDATSIPVESASTALATNHVTSHQNVQDAIEAIEAKVGVDGSAVTTSHDYKLSGVTGTDKAVSKTGNEVLTNKTLTAPTITSPKITVGSDAVGDLHITSNVDGTQSRLAIGANNYILKSNGTTAVWGAETVTVDASTSVKGIVEAATSAEVTAGTATGGTGAVLAVTPDALAASTPVFDGSGLTGLDKVRIATVFEGTGRFTETNTGGGDTIFGTNGISLQVAGGTGVGSTSVTMITVSGASQLYSGNPTFSCHVEADSLASASATGSSFFGLGNPTVATAGHTYTVGHAGFKIIKTGGTVSLYATQADGSTETASSALTTLTDGDTLDLILKINGSTNVKYYWRKNGGSLSSATTLTTNMPAGTSQSMQFSTSNDNADNVFNFKVTGACYER